MPFRNASNPTGAIEEAHAGRVIDSLQFQVLLYALSAIVFIASFYIILKQAIVNFKYRNKSHPKGLASQGQIYKGLFFVSLFVTCLCKFIFAIKLYRQIFQFGVIGDFS